MDDTPDFVRYGTARAWSRELGVPFKVLRDRLVGLPFVRGRTNAGGWDFFYAEPEVRRACADLLGGRTGAAGNRSTSRSSLTICSGVYCFRVMAWSSRPVRPSGLSYHLDQFLGAGQTGTDESGNKTAGTHKIIDRDHSEWAMAVSSRDGKLLLDVAGKCTRRKE